MFTFGALLASTGACMFAFSDNPKELRVAGGLILAGLLAILAAAVIAVSKRML